MLDVWLQEGFSAAFKASVKEILGDLFSSGIGSVPSPELLEREGLEFALTGGEGLELRGFPLRTLKTSQWKAGRVQTGFRQSLNEMNRIE